MGDAFLVGRSDGVCKRNRELEELAQREPVFGQKLRQGLPLHELHGDEVDPVCLFDGVDGNDVGVIECGDRFGFSSETSPALFALGKLRRQDFQRHLAVQLGVLGQIDFSHPA